MNKRRNFGNVDLNRIVRSVLKEQVTQTTTTTPTVQNTQPSTGTTTPSNTATTNPNTATTTPTTASTTNQEVVVTFGTDSNAKNIDNTVRKRLGQRIKDVFKRKPQVPTNESFNNSLVEEMSKMSFLLNYERGVVLSEQKVLLESDGSDAEKPPYNAPIVTVKKLNNTEWRVNAFGTFPVNVTTGTLATQFMDAIADKIYQDPMLADPKYKGRVTMTVAHIVGGASNYNNGPVKPDVDAAFQSSTGSIIYPATKAVKDESIFTGNHDLNSQLAKGRAVNLFRVIKTQLPLRTEKSIKMLVKEEILGYNVNTGGVVDKDRNSKLYPVPGQHVNMSLIIKIRPANPSKVGSLGCMKNLQIRIETTKHGCDTAAFDVKLNGAPLGAVDLGNWYVGTTIEDELGNIRSLLPGSQTDGKQGGFRYRIFQISDSQAKSFVTTNDGSVLITVKGRDSSDYEKRFGLGSNQTYAGSMSTHSDVPFVTISKSDGTIIYKQAPTPNTYAFGGSRKPCGATGNPCKEYELIKFNPCATNLIDGDLTGF